MPQMDGYQTTQEILTLCRQSNVAAPYIVAHTAYAEGDEEVLRKCKENEMNEVKNKPVKAKELMELFDKLSIGYKF